MSGGGSSNGLSTNFKVEIIVLLKRTKLTTDQSWKKIIVFELKSLHLKPISRL